MNAVFEIVLVVVIVTKKGRRDVILLEHRDESRHVRIVALAPRDGGDRRMVGGDESVFGFLMGHQIVLEPASLCPPKRAPLPLVQCSVLNIAVDDDKMAIAPIKRIIRRSILKEFSEIVCVAFVVAERRKEHGSAKKISFDSKENGPKRAVVSISYHVTRMQNEVRNAVCHQLSDNALMHIVPRPRVAIDHKTIRHRLPGRW